MTFPDNVYPISLHGVTKATLFRCLDGLILVDTGMNAEHAELILTFARDSLKLPLEQYGKLCFITHSHLDHIGGLATLVQLCPFEVASHIQEADIIKEKTGVKVNVLLKDGDMLPYCPSAQLIHVAGHTKGNSCIYVKDKALLIVGDTLNTLHNDQLEPPKDEYNMDSTLARKELQKLAGLDIQYIVICHGKDVEKDGKHQLNALLNKLTASTTS